MPDAVDARSFAPEGLLESLADAWDADPGEAERTIRRALAMLSPDKQRMVAKVLQRVAILQAERGVEVAEAALERVIELLGPRRPRAN